MACFVLSCKSHSSRKGKDGKEFVSFHRMPRKDREKWCKMLTRAKHCWTRHSRICSNHFTDDCFVCTDKWRRLKPGAIPSLLLDPHDDENLHQNPGRQPLKTDHNYHIKEEHVESQVNTGSSQAIKIEENEMPISSSSCCSELRNKMKKLEHDFEKAKKLSKRRLLKMNALRKQTKRLKQKNFTLQNRLHEILIEEHLEQDKLLMLDAV